MTEPTDAQMCNAWVFRTKLYDGDLMRQLYDFGRACVALAQSQPVQQDTKVERSMRRQRDDAVSRARYWKQRAQSAEGQLALALPHPVQPEEAVTRDAEDAAVLAMRSGLSTKSATRVVELYREIDAHLAEDKPEEAVARDSQVLLDAAYAYAKDSRHTTFAEAGTAFIAGANWQAALSRDAGGAKR